MFYSLSIFTAINRPFRALALLYDFLNGMEQGIKYGYALNRSSRHSGRHFEASGKTTLPILLPDGMPERRFDQDFAAHNKNGLGRGSTFLVHQFVKVVLVCNQRAVLKPLRFLAPMANDGEPGLPMNHPDGSGLVSSREFLTVCREMPR